MFFCFQLNNWFGSLLQANQRQPLPSLNQSCIGLCATNFTHGDLNNVPPDKGVLALWQNVNIMNTNDYLLLYCQERP